MRQLTLQGRITVFKSLAISKVARLLLITKLHNNTINITYKIQKKSIWQGNKAKIKHSCAFFFFSAKNLNFIGQFFNDNGNTNPWEEIKIEF